jgi:hypothetical protein
MDILKVKLLNCQKGPGGGEGALGALRPSGIESGIPWGKLEVRGKRYGILFDTGIVSRNTGLHG